MNPLLEQFLSEARDLLQSIGEKLMQLEDSPGDAERMTALFRMVHTLKGNSGLFDFPEMTRVLHAAEDLMDGVRQGRVSYSKELADALLDSMDFVGRLCDEIEAPPTVPSSHAEQSANLATSLRGLIVGSEPDTGKVGAGAARAVAARSLSGAAPGGVGSAGALAGSLLLAIPDSVRREAHRQACDGVVVHWLEYSPKDDCFFQGEDPFFQARSTPGLLWGTAHPREPWPALAELDAYRCVLTFNMLTSAPRAELESYFRYMPEQVRFVALSPDALATSVHATGRPLELIEPTLAQDESEALEAIVAIQRHVLTLPISARWHLGRLEAVAASLSSCLGASGDHAAISGLEAAAAQARETGRAAPLLLWLDDNLRPRGRATGTRATEAGLRAEASGLVSPVHEPPRAAAVDVDMEPKFGRRAEDAITATKSLKVDQTKIDRLMNLIGEIVVSKNALPYLAARADTVFGVRDLSREITAQYAVINRIAEEMQDAIMQVRMMPVSFVLQRFPRLVRDTSRKLGKEVNLVLQGEDTEADKNIIEALGDPLLHVVRNSLDHGFELPDVRRAAGKSQTGTLTIRASQESDRVIIEITDDGKGIDPAVVKLKAYQKGLIDEATLERIGDQDAANLVFLPGFSTADVVSELSGRGVGMDVVKTAVEKVNGTVTLTSEKGKGTHIRLALPLSMAVTNVMIVETDGQTFGVPMESVVETVRVPESAIRTIEASRAAVLRGRIVPLKSVNELLGLAALPKPNAEGELAVLVVRFGGESVGLLVDEFRETAEILLKPMTGVLAGLSGYSGSALMGDGSVLMVLNAKEMLS